MTGRSLILVFISAWAVAPAACFGFGTAGRMGLDGARHRDGFTTAFALATSAGVALLVASQMFPARTIALGALVLAALTLFSIGFFGAAAGILPAPRPTAICRWGHGGVALAAGITLATLAFVVQLVLLILIIIGFYVSWPLALTSFAFGLLHIVAVGRCNGMRCSMRCRRGARKSGGAPTIYTPYRWTPPAAPHPNPSAVPRPADSGSPVPGLAR